MYSIILGVKISGRFVSVEMICSYRSVARAVLMPSHCVTGMARDGCVTYRNRFPLGVDAEKHLKIDSIVAEGLFA